MLFRPALTLSSLLLLLLHLRMPAAVTPSSTTWLRYGIIVIPNRSGSLGILYQTGMRVNPRLCGERNNNNNARIL